MNKKQAFLIIAIVYLTCFVTTDSFGEESKKHIWEIGSEISYITNKIPYLKSHGTMYGSEFSCTYHGNLPLFFKESDDYMLKIEGEARCGKIDNNVWLDDTKEYILEFRGLAGYDFAVTMKSRVTPYLGIGYRYLKMNKDGLYNEDKIVYLYNPIGIEISTELKQKWCIGVSLEYDYFLWGKVHHANSSFIYGDNEFKQEKGYGLRSSVKFQKKANKVDLSVEPFLKYWHIKESKTESYYTNRTLGGTTYYNNTYPKNHSTEIGVRFAVKF